MMDSKFLENIEIENSTCEKYILQMGEICNLEQWKNAKVAEIYRFDIWSPAIFSNFEKSKGYCIDLAPEDVVLLKEKFLANPNFKKCKIHYQRLENGVFEAIGENPRIWSDDYGEKRIWLLDTVDPDKILRIEHSEEQILTFSMEKNIFKILETLDLF
ncbi:hypothetical protein B9Z55_021556 [Caenorhabditis nigoni]|nr:hypothetical protein B9Z55_021556 [Caenorhabditis nigoni]